MAEAVERSGKRIRTLSPRQCGELTIVRRSVGVADQRLLASHELGHCRLFRESLRRRTLTLAPSQAGLFHRIPCTTIDRTRNPPHGGEEPRAR